MTPKRRTCIRCGRPLREDGGSCSCLVDFVPGIQYQLDRAIEAWIKACTKENVDNREQPGYVPDMRHTQPPSLGGWAYHYGGMWECFGYTHIFVAIEDSDASVGYFIALFDSDDGEFFGMTYNETINGVATWIEAP